MMNRSRATTNVINGCHEFFGTLLNYIIKYILYIAADKESILLHFHYTVLVVSLSIQCPCG